MVATVIHITDDTNSIIVALGTIFSSIIAVGGGIAVAIISRKQSVQGRKIDDVHEQLKTSNGKSVGNYVEEIAKNGSND